MKRLALLLAIALFLLMPTSVAAAECQFVLGFATLRDLIGHEIVGECLENEHHGANGDALQQTNGGLLVWRKADNWTAFTDGYRTWINGPNGLVQRLNTERFEWEADYAPGGGIATPTPTPTPQPTPTPDASAKAEEALENLPWVRDGQAYFEVLAVRHLRGILAVSPQVFWEIMQISWMRTDSSGLNSPWSGELFKHIRLMAEKDEDTVLRIVQMPFMEPDGFDAKFAWDSLSDIFHSDPEGLQRLFAHPMLRDGIFGDHIALLPLLYLERLEPEAAAAIEALPWSEVKPWSSEKPWAFERLRRLALASQPVFWAWMDLYKNEPDRYASILENITIIARADKAAALQILKMPFLETKDVGDDGRIIRLLASLEPEGLRQILSDSRLHGGITDDHKTTLDLLILGLEHPQAVAVIEALPWVQDGVNRRAGSYLSADTSHPTEYEEGAVESLIRLASISPMLVSALASKPWVQDGMTSVDHEVIYSFRGIASRDRDLGQKILSMPFLDSAEYQDYKMLETLRTMWDDTAGVRWIIAHPRLAGGINDDQRATVALLRLERENLETAKVIWSLPWVADGVTASETPAALALYELAQDSTQVFHILAAKPWIQDTLSEAEQSVIEDLSSIAKRSDSERDEAAALRIAAMPFLESVSVTDAAAVYSLFRLHIDEDANYMRNTLSHPTLRDGIRDEQAALVAVLSTVARSTPELLNSMLAPGQAFVTQRTLENPRLGNVELIVAATSREASGDLDLLEYAMRSHMAFMDLPFPTSYVVVWVHDRGSGGGGGSGQLHVGSYGNPSVVAHEAAHVYWPFAPTWIAEGGAEFLEQISENARVGSPIRPFNEGKCNHANTLERYEQLAHEWEQKRLLVFSDLCPYALGSGLLVDLFRTLGDGVFREGFRRLYHKLHNRQHESECHGLERGVCYFKFAFVTEASPRAAAIAEPIINRWYYGSERGRQ